MLTFKPPHSFRQRWNVCTVIPASLQTCGVVLSFAMLRSICLSVVTICRGLYLWMDLTRFSSKWVFSLIPWYKFRLSHPSHVLERPRAVCCLLFLTTEIVGRQELK
jgi:hypothetical protein